MKRAALLLSTCFLLIDSYAQNTLSATDWQADLRFLQQTVHKDYSFLFKNVTAAQFDTEVDKLYHAIPGIEEHETVAGLARIVSLFKYGHTDIGWREGTVKYHVVPMNLYWFSDGIYVEGVDKQYPQVVGAKLVKVEGMPVGGCPCSGKTFSAG